MSTTPSSPAGVPAASGRRPGKGKAPAGVALGQERSREARRLAAAILEVLAGARTPAEAALALGLSLPRYYHVEGQALRGLLAACEPKPPGRVPDPKSEVTALRQQNQRLTRELARQQALVRMGQRAVGLAAPAPAAASTPGKKTRKRRRARALGVAARLQAQTQEPVSAAAAPETPRQPL